MTQPSNEIEARIAETLEASKSPFNVCPKECKEDIRWLCETLRSSRLEVETLKRALKEYANRANWKDYPLEGLEEVVWRHPSDWRGCVIAEQALSPKP